jgi:hypothetical protein
MRMQRRYSKREMLGRLRIDYLFSNDQLPGIIPESSRWEKRPRWKKVCSPI